MRRNKFSLSHTKLLSCDMGSLVPCGLVEVLPGDTFQQATSALIRVSPLLTPVMHPVDIRIHHWFVPHRLVWNQWEDFITGGPEGISLPDFPTIEVDSGEIGGLADYLGIPQIGQVAADTRVSALPFRAYTLIWNEFYRDQDLEAKAFITVESGNDNSTNVQLLNCDWEKDYFTSARPWTQKGPEVSIGIGAEAPVVPATVNAYPTFNFVGTSGSRSIGATGGTANAIWDGAVATTAIGTWDDPALVTDLSEASAISINDLREAFALQRYEEARARYGSRYTEYLRYLGVRSSDARLQRPEYLGGGRQTIQFSEVLQTGPDTEDAGVANLKGHGIGALRSNRYRRFFEEHGYVISLLSVRPKTMYAQGIARTWNRRYKEDFFQKELQAIGQQEVLNKEIYANHAQPNGTFGYQDRYDEYRRQESTIAGEFRTTLNMWHYARIFGSTPALNAAFVKAVPTKRVNAVQSEHVLWCMIRHSLQARRLVASTGRSHIF